jgi:hypothetical protein
MFVIGRLVQVSVVLIAVYYVYRMGLSVAIFRAVRAGDDERVQRLRGLEIQHKIRSVGFQFLALGLVALVSLVVVVVLVAKQ